MLPFFLAVQSSHILGKHDSFWSFLNIQEPAACQKKITQSVKCFASGTDVETMAIANHLEKEPFIEFHST